MTTPRLSRTLQIYASLLLMLLLPLPTLAQSLILPDDPISGGPFQISWFPVLGSGNPTGVCGSSQIYIDTTSGATWTCNGGTWLLIGPSAGGATANPTVGIIPYLSAANTYSDSPLARDGADLVSIRHGANTEQLNIYDAYFGALSDGIQFIGSGVIQTFATGGNSPPIALALNSTNTSGNATISMTAGTNGTFVLQDSNTRVVKQYGNTITAGTGIPPIYGTIPTPDTDRTASLTDTTIVSAPHAGLYRFSVAVISSNTCATPGPAGVTVGLKWTDAIGAKSIASIPLDVNGGTTFLGSVPLGDTTSFGTGTMTIKVDTSQAIQVNTTLTGCTTGTAKYRLDGAVEELR